MKHIETGRRFRNQNWFSEQQMHIKLDFFLENISNIARMDFVGIKKLQLKHDEAKERDKDSLFFRFTSRTEVERVSANKF